MGLRCGVEAGTPLTHGESFERGGVRFSLYPAGHVMGSAQVLMEYAGERVVVTGDYKRRPDPTYAPFELVLEVAFDSIHESKRHKSGLAMRFPRIHRIRKDKPADEADKIATLKAMVS